LIDTKFGNNDKASTIFYNAVNASLNNITKNVNNFIDELSDDIKKVKFKYRIFLQKK
jgi:hypothetical protein